MKDPDRGRCGSGIHQRQEVGNLMNDGMNPTEKFIEELMRLLKEHEEATGTYIYSINVKRYSTHDVGKIRGRQVITGVELGIR